MALRRVKVAIETLTKNTVAGAFAHWRRTTTQEFTQQQHVMELQRRAILRLMASSKAMDRAALVKSWLRWKEFRDYQVWHS